MRDFDFTGFSFGDWNSHDENTGLVTIYRVSGGDRYEEQLHPEIKDLTAEIAGIDGQYYFGSSYGVKQFDIEITFDSLTEEQFRKLRKVFSTKEPQKLIFDERPYKYYLAKLESPIELSYVCFDEPKKELTSIEGIRYKDENDNYTTTHTVMRATNECARIYKGEGKISFICHYPFAKSVQKTLPQEGSEGWAISSGILSENDYNTGEFDVYNNESGIINIYNAGDLPTGFQLYIPFTDTEKTSVTISYRINSTQNFQPMMQLTDIIKHGNTTGFNDIGILIDTNTGLIQGVEQYTTEIKRSVNLYNRYIEAGYFFKLECNDLSTDGAQLKIEIKDEDGEAIQSAVEIFYDYLYF